ncbi:MULTISPECIES: hypothetical protein [Mycolicibacter]|uniref:Uncharacterized protein n=2 Tax=Mycolicibacter TaxID=1073531 RepID=A0ABU5XLC2_9MYCO|nr:MULTISPECIES: hypothetical protein [unclassified Mycolicibacter]MEB3023062.1 hypothetical protein [Mycolicibacter sp. MYC098]MEB3033572.1 hypothetical protein [Mycolicibacter sp. MYC340]
MSGFAKAMAAFCAVQERYASVGAADTEPREVMLVLLDELRAGGCVEVPTSAAGWSLFDDVAGVERAVQALTAAARSVIEAGRHEPDALDQYFEQYLK